MANHKSAIKRTRQSEVRRERNRANRSRLKTAVKKVHEAVGSESAEQAQESLKLAVPLIAKMASKGLVHKNNAARKISRLTRRVNALSNA